LAGLASTSLLFAPRAINADSPIRFGASATESFGESFYLLDGGFLDKAGLSGNVQVFNTSGQIIAGIAGNSLDVGVSDISQIANAVNKGLPFSFFAGSSVYRSDAPATVLCVAKESPLRDVRELEGKTIGVNGLKTLAEMSTRETVRLAGGDPAKLQFVEISPTLAIPALSRGTLAATIVSEPFLSSARESVRIFAKPHDAVAKQFYICAWFAKSDWLTADPTTTRRLTKAIYDAADWTNHHHDETAPILVKYLKFDPDRAKTLARATFDTKLDPKLMQPVLDIAYKYGLIQQQVNASSLIARVN
jgi:NitT/TauT family transport system substrate-binding protein